MTLVERLIALRKSRSLFIELRVNGGNVELVLAPGMVVDANELSVRHSTPAISKDAGDDTPETLHVHLLGRMRHGRLATRWQTPRTPQGPDTPASGP